MAQSHFIGFNGKSLSLVSYLLSGNFFFESIIFLKFWVSVCGIGSGQPHPFNFMCISCLRGKEETIPSLNALTRLTQNITNNECSLPFKYAISHNKVLSTKHIKQITVIITFALYSSQSTRTLSRSPSLSLFDSFCKIRGL